MNRLALYEDYESDLSHECNDCQNHEILIDECGEYLDEIIDQIYNFKDIDHVLLHHSISQIASLLKKKSRMKSLSSENVWVRHLK